jgi:hypothetical protein
MPLRVIIENTDHDRAIEVIEVATAGGRRSESAPYRIAPGAQIARQVHLSGDLLIREVKPG